MRSKKACKANGNMHEYYVEIVPANGNGCIVNEMIHASSVIDAYVQALEIAKALDKASETECKFTVKSVSCNN